MTQIQMLLVIFVSCWFFSCANLKGVEKSTADSQCIILDKKSGLMWATSDNGEDISWESAAVYCKNYKAGGYLNWRMPSIEELRKIFTRRNQRKYNTKIYINVGGKYLWSSNVDHTSYSAGYLFTKDGFYLFGPMYGKKFKARALPVRNIVKK